MTAPIVFSGQPHAGAPHAGAPHAGAQRVSGPAPGNGAHRPAAPAQLAAEQPRPKVRMQAPDEILPAQNPRLTLPPPEQFGIGANFATDVNPAPSAVAPSTAAPAAAPVPVDWNVAKQRLDRLGVVAFHSDRLAHGGFRISVLLPTGQGTHHVEAEAASEAVAVAVALDRAEAWATRR